MTSVPHYLRYVGFIKRNSPCYRPLRILLHYMTSVPHYLRYVGFIIGNSPCFRLMRVLLHDMTSVPHYLTYVGFIKGNSVGFRLMRVLLHCMTDVDCIVLWADSRQAQYAPTVWTVWTGPILCRPWLDLRSVSILFSSGLSCTSSSRRLSQALRRSFSVFIFLL